MATELPYWLLLESLTVCGREDDDDEGSSDGDSSEDDDDDDDEGDSSDDSSKDDSKKKKDDDDEDVRGLLSALRSERQQRKSAERKNKAYERQLNSGKKKTKDDDGGDDGSKDDSELQEKLRSEQTKTTRLAERLRLREIDAAIVQAAQEAGFIDPTDAVTDFIRNEVEYDQDEDDPADVDVDMDTVVEAVKKLARKKKHLVGEVPDKSRQKSGSKFRKKTGDDDKSTMDKTLATNYPSLR